MAVAREDQGHCWPEQEACEEWWRKHCTELKDATTAYRMKLQTENRELRRMLQVFVDTDDFSKQYPVDSSVLSVTISEAREFLEVRKGT